MNHLDPSPYTRRAFLSRGTLGVGSVALAWLLQQDSLLAKNEFSERVSYDLKPKVPAHVPRTRAIISLFMHGGPSQVDLLDPKPELSKRDGAGQKFPNCCRMWRG